MILPGKAAAGQPPLQRRLRCESLRLGIGWCEGLEESGIHGAPAGKVMCQRFGQDLNV